MRHAIERRGRRATSRSAVVGLAARARRHLRSVVAPAASLAVAALVGTLALAPLPQATVTSAAVASASVVGAPGTAQDVTVDGTASESGLAHESYVATTGPETLVESGTNYDWAKLVLIEGGWPLTEANIAVMVEWMREENGPDNWWNRNNPLNNGHGSGGGSGLGSYDSLRTAAWYAADNLVKRSFYTAIVAGFERGDAADATRAAIWASPWASSHYGNGANWSVNPPVPVVTAPAGAWD